MELDRYEPYFRQIADQNGNLHLDNSPRSLDLSEITNYGLFFPELMTYEIEGEIMKLDKESCAHKIQKISIFTVIHSGYYYFGPDEVRIFDMFQKATGCKEISLSLCFLPEDVQQNRYLHAERYLGTFLRSMVQGLQHLESLTLSDDMIHLHVDGQISWERCLNIILNPYPRNHHNALITWDSSQHQSIIPRGAHHNLWFRKASFKRLCLKNIRMTSSTSQFFWLLIGCFHLEHLELINTQIEWPTAEIFQLPFPVQVPHMRLQVSDNRASQPLNAAFFRAFRGSNVELY